MRAYVSENVEDMRRTECERLDTLLMQLWPAVLNGDGKAIERAAHIIKLHADISGATAPARLNIAALVLNEEMLAALPLELVDAMAGGNDITQAFIEVMKRLPAPEPKVDVPAPTVVDVRPMYESPDPDDPPVTIPAPTVPKKSSDLVQVSEIPAPVERHEPE
jgi:hypothetical protein